MIISPVSSRIVNNIKPSKRSCSNDINPNICPEEQSPLIFQLNLDSEIFPQVYSHHNTDKNIKYNGKTLTETAEAGELKLNPSILRYLEEAADVDCVNKMKSIYEENGTFTLEQIEDYIGYKNFGEIKYYPLNNIGEYIAHFIPEIFLEETYDDNSRLRTICNALYNQAYDFGIGDDFGRSALRKAVEAENIPAVRLLLEYSGNVSDFNEIVKIAKESDNEELKELLCKYIR